MPKRDLQAWIAKQIDTSGRAVIGVFPGPDSTDPTNDAFAYSIGNARHLLPEVLIVGMCDKNAMWLVNAVSEELRRGFRTGELDLGGRCGVYVLPASDEANLIPNRETSCAKAFEIPRSRRGRHRQQSPHPPQLDREARLSARPVDRTKQPNLGRGRGPGMAGQPPHRAEGSAGIEARKPSRPATQAQARDVWSRV